MNDGQQLLFQCLKAQIYDSSRFSPVPEFCRTGSGGKDKLGVQSCDMKIFEQAVNDLELCEEKKDDPKDGSYADLLLQFIKKTPIVLKHSNMLLGKTNISFYKVEHTSEVEDKFLDLKSKSSLLFHGSSLCNWHSIIHNGLKVMSHTKFMTTGAVHGDGIYLTNSIGMACGYSSGRASNHGFIIGVYEIYNVNKYKKTPSIYVVPSEKLLILRYLIKADKLGDTTLGDESFQKYFETAAENARKQRIKDAVNALKCIVNDLKLLDIKNIEKLTPFEYTQGKNIIEFPPSYPFNPPSVNGKKITGWDVERHIELLQKILR